MKKISFWRPFSKIILSDYFASQKTLESVFFASTTLDSSFGVKVSAFDKIEEIAREKCLSEIAERAVFFASIGEIGLREPLLFYATKSPPSQQLQGQIEFPYFENSEALKKFLELQNLTSVGYCAERTQSPLFLNCMNELQERAILLNQPYLASSESHLLLDEICGEIFQLCLKAAPNGLQLHLSFGPLGILIAVRDSVSKECLGSNLCSNECVDKGILHALLECAAIVLPDTEVQELVVEMGVFKTAYVASSYKTQTYDYSDFSFNQWEVSFPDFSRFVARLSLSFSNLFNCDIFFNTVVSSFSKMYGSPSQTTSITVFDNSSIVVQDFVHFHQALDKIGQIQSFGSLICPTNLGNQDSLPRELCLLNAVFAMSKQKWEFLHENFSSHIKEPKYTISSATQAAFEQHIFAELASRSEGAWFTPIERLSWSNIYEHRLKSFQEGRIVGLHQGGTLIGTVEISQACPKDGVLFNFITVLPQFRKQGYAHHLINEVQKYVFENTSASSLLSFVSVQNIPSMRAFKSNSWSCVAWVYAKLL